MVSSGCPDLSVTASSVIDQASQSFRFKVWDLILDDDCIDPPNFINTIDSGLITVVNSACQPCEGSVELSKATILSDRPLNYSICKNQYDWLYVWIPANLATNPTITITTDSGVNDVPLIMGKVNCIPVGSIGSDYIQPTDTSIEISIQPTNDIINITVKDCCCKNKCQIAFLEPKGSFKSMDFDETDLTIITEATEVCKIQSCDLTLAERCKKSGISLTDITYYEQITCKTVIDWNDENEKLVKAFFANPNKFVIRNINGTDRLVKLLMASGGFSIKREEEACIELTITGKFNTELVGAISDY